MSIDCNLQAPLFCGRGMVKIDFPPLELSDSLLIDPKIFGGERGFFMEPWSNLVFAENGPPENGFLTTP
jgi:dTDP-4-dehydrorhamnose 3,5-epimerase-like enzyme